MVAVATVVVGLEEGGRVVVKVVGVMEVGAVEDWVGRAGRRGDCGGEAPRR